MFPIHRFEIEFVRNIKVGRYSFRIAIDHDGFVACFLNGEHAMYAAIIKFNSLTNPIGTGTQDYNFLFRRRNTFIFQVESAIEVWGLRFKFSSAGVDHFISTTDTMFVSLTCDFLFVDAEEPRDLGI